MTDTDVRELVREVLESGHLMSLATSDDRGVWVSDVIYVHDDQLSIYWLSQRNTRHSRAILKNNRVAATITVSPDSRAPNVGLPLTGTAEEIGGTFGK